MYSIPVLAKERMSRTKSHPRKGANRPEVFDIGRAKGMTRFDGSSGNQGVGQLDAVGEGMLFDDRGCGGTNGFGERQYTKPELAERLPDLAGFQLRASALNEFHKGDDGERAICDGVDGPRSAQATQGSPDQHICIEDHFGLPAVRFLLMPASPSTARGWRRLRTQEELVDTCGFASGYQSVRRFVSRLQVGQSSEPCAVIETAPGEEAQVDYGDGPMVRDPQSGKYRRARLFVLTLGYSRKSVRLLVFRSSSQAWAELHEKAFRRHGGVTRVVVLDNLREGVLTPDIYDPTLNPLYRDMLRHYGAVPLPCRVGHPDRKGKVESGVGHAKRAPLKGLRFESLQAAQDHLDHWEAHWADTRIHGTTKRQVAAMFAEERPSLLPLPVEPFRYYLYGERSVHLDGCVEVEAAYYSAPPGWIGRRVQVQWDSRQVRLLDPQTGQLLREHLCQVRGGHRIKDEDRSRKTPLGTQQLLYRADKAGSQIGALCRGMHQAQGETAVRRIMGVLSLGKKYGMARVDDACAAALEVGTCDYHFVRRYPDRNPQPPLSLRQIDPLIRQLTLYRDFIDNKTNQESKE